MNDLIKKYINTDNGWEMQIIKQVGTGREATFSILVTLPLEKLPFVVDDPGPSEQEKFIETVKGDSPWMEEEGHLTPRPKGAPSKKRTVIEEMERLGMSEEVIEKVRQFQAMKKKGR